MHNNYLNIVIYTCLPTTGIIRYMYARLHVRQFNDIMATVYNK